MKKIICFIIIAILLCSSFAASFPVNAVTINKNAVASYDDDEDEYDSDDENDDEDSDDEDDGDDEDDEDDKYDENDGGAKETGYDESAEGKDPEEKATSYTATEKAADENNFLAYQYCGNGLNWYIRNNELVIFGHGNMYDYEQPSDAPWYEKTYSKIIIRHGVTSISENAFANTKARILTLPSSVTEISRYAFMNASSLESVTLGKDMVSVDEYAFFNCSSLAQVTFNNNLTKIGVSAFENCTSLGDIRLPKTLKYIYVNTFKGCSALCSVILRNG